VAFILVEFMTLTYRKQRSFDLFSRQVNLYLCKFRAVTMNNSIFLDVTLCGFLRTDVSGEYIASFIRMARIGELGTRLSVTSNKSTS
jgi:hypothetical protein